LCEHNGCLACRLRQSGRINRNSLCCWKLKTVSWC
jgi:hypothetical protein